MPRHLFQVTVNLPGSFRNNLNNNEVFNPYVFVRNRLYHFVFNRFALIYARLVSELQRKFLEFVLLLTALFCFSLLVYVHVVFVQTPMTCLDSYKSKWLKNGVLRVEVLSQKGKLNYTLEDSYWKEKTLRLMQFDGQAQYFYTDSTMKDDSEPSLEETVPSSENVLSNETVGSVNEIVSEFVEADDTQPIANVSSHVHEEIFTIENFQQVSEESILASDPEGAYIMEFSLEYGYLRLRPSKRKELNISVTFVVLDPETDKCFGGTFNKFLLDNFLGYDNVLLASIKNMAEKKDQKGFVRNAVMEIEYIFINNWTNEKSYFTALFVMLVFTLTISTLLRHSHYQIFIVVGFWMHHVIASLERPSNLLDIVFPRNLIPSSGAPVVTVVLALVGMEAVMSDFFHDRSIALHIIVIVWLADLYEAVCCQSTVSKKYWFRFFYLYHYLFYAYNYKFSGVYWPLTLLTSWLFTFHSMVFFFHHYELPRFLHRAARSNANRPPQNGQEGNTAGSQGQQQNPAVLPTDAQHTETANPESQQAAQSLVTGSGIAAASGTENSPENVPPSNQSSLHEVGAEEKTLDSNAGTTSIDDSSQSSLNGPYLKQSNNTVLQSDDKLVTEKIDEAPPEKQGGSNEIDRSSLVSSRSGQTVSDQSLLNCDAGK